jgi:hypothetical protein
MRVRPVSQSLGPDLFAFPSPHVATPAPTAAGVHEQAELRAQYTALLPDTRKLPLDVPPLRAPRSTIATAADTDSNRREKASAPNYGTPLDRQREQ